MRRTVLVGGLLILFSMSLVATAQPTTRPASRRAATSPSDPSFAAVTDDPKLPRVLIIGDSISMGYTIPVRTLLRGKANVHRPAVNCGPTTRGVEQLDGWLGGGRWDVIHFNFGLHDLAFVDDKGARAEPPAGHHMVTPELYEANLRTIVTRLQRTGARLIWANTTPVPDASPARIKGEEAVYNAIAAKVKTANPRL